MPVYPPEPPIAAVRPRSHVPVPQYPTAQRGTNKKKRAHLDSEAVPPATQPAASQAQAQQAQPQGGGSPASHDKMRTSDLVAPEITYHVPHAHQSAGHFSSLVRPHGPSAQPPSVGSRLPPPVVTPVPPPKPPTLSSGAPVDRSLQPAPRADRNIDKVVLGDLCFRTWYPSYYGKELLGDLGVGSGSNAKAGKVEETGKSSSSKRDREHHHQPVLERLYVCPSCFKYSKELVAWWGHVRVCERKGRVPGHKIYVHPQGRRKVLVPEGGPRGLGPKRRRGDSGVRYVEQTIQDEGEWSIWEVDGEDERVSWGTMRTYDYARVYMAN